jgi:phytoene dehydrogenase-like protein
VATGVEIETGHRGSRRTVHVRAGQVVSNADLILTLEQLIGPEHVGAEHIRQLRRLQPTMPCYLVHIGLRNQPPDELDRAAGYHWRSWDTERVATDMFKIFVPTAFDPSVAPPGCQIVVLQKVTAVDYENIRDWAAHKLAIETDLMQRLEAVIPGVGARMVSRQTASALTSWRFTLNHHGAMLGWEMAPDQLGERRPAIESPIRNLHYVGHWTRPGGGITPVIVSAMDVAREIGGMSTPGMTVLSPAQRHGL